MGILGLVESVTHKTFTNKLLLKIKNVFLVAVIMHKVSLGLTIMSTADRANGQCEGRNTHKTGPQRGRDQAR